jgi:hypothetical protein
MKSKPAAALEQYLEHFKAIENPSEYLKRFLRDPGLSLVPEDNEHD